jgi:hypothetical protein
VSESRGEGQPEGSGQPRNSSGQPKGSNGQPKNSNGQPRSGGNGQPGSGRGQSRPSDPVADFQRWLMKAGARSMANQVADQVKRTIGAERRNSGDVWDTATNEPPPTEAPECQWCPICQAARAARLGGAGGLGAALSGASTVVSTVVQDAFSAFEQVMKVQEQNRSAERAGTPRPSASAPETGAPRPSASAPETRAPRPSASAPEDGEETGQ